MSKSTLESFRPCREAAQFVAKFPSAQAAWDACENSQWLLWILDKTQAPTHGQWVELACRFAEAFIPRIPAGEDRPAKAIAAAYAAAARAAWAAADAAAYAAARAAGAADAAAWAAWAAADAAAYAAARAAQCATIRDMFPECPVV